MKTLKAVSFVLLTVISTGTISAQSADEVVNKYVTAMGGKEILGNIKTIYVESSMNMMGNEVPVKTYLSNGKGYKTEMDFNGQTIVQCVTDKGGWAQNPMMGQTTPTALPEDQVKAGQAQLEIGGPLFNYAAKGNKIELIGKDTVASKPQFKLKVTPKVGEIATYYIDANTGYLTKVVSNFSGFGQEGERTITFADYKKTDFGYVMAYSQEIIMPQVTLSITHNKIEINKALDPAIFEMPKP